MIFFDLLYYHIYRFYSDFNEKGAESTSAGIIGGFQTLNVFTGIMLFQLGSQHKTYINKLGVVVLFIVFQVFTYLRYIYKENHSVNFIEERWLSKTETARKRLSAALFLYAFISIISCFGLAIYLGGRD